MHCRVLTLHGDPKEHDEVIAETNSRENTTTRQRYIERALIGMVTLQLRGLDGHKPEDGHRAEQHLGNALLQHFLLSVPTAAFKEEAVYECTVFGLHGGVNAPRIADHLEIELDVVNGNFVLPGIVLFDACQETLCEMESTHPEDCRRAIFDPAC